MSWSTWKVIFDGSRSEKTGFILLLRFLLNHCQPLPILLYNRASERERSELHSDLTMALRRRVAEISADSSSAEAAAGATRSDLTSRGPKLSAAEREGDAPPLNGAPAMRAPTAEVFRGGSTSMFGGSPAADAAGSSKKMRLTSISLGPLISPAPANRPRWA